MSPRNAGVTSSPKTRMAASLSSSVTTSPTRSNDSRMPPPKLVRVTPAEKAPSKQVRARDLADRQHQQPNRHHPDRPVLRRDRRQPASQPHRDQRDPHPD